MTEQFINKSTLKDNFTVIPNNMLNDEGIDADCLAGMVYLLSKPSNWIVKPTNIQNRFKFGRDKTYRVINQLVKKKYIVREEHRTEGKYSSFSYYVYDSPFPGLPYTAEPYTANQYTTKYREVLSKEKILMTDQLKTDLNTVSESYKWYKNWLTEYKMVNDTIDILDGRIINFSIDFLAVGDIGLNKNDLFTRVMFNLSNFFSLIKILVLFVSSKCIIDDFSEKIKEMNLFLL